MRPIMKCGCPGLVKSAGGTPICGEHMPMEEASEVDHWEPEPEEDGRCEIPSGVLMQLKDYRNRRAWRPPLSPTVRAMLENKFRKAICLMDHETLCAVRTIAQWIHNELPAESHGSPMKVASWLSAGS